VQEDLFVRSLKERRTELAAAGLQVEFYLERERKARSAALDVALLLL